MKPIVVRGNLVPTLMSVFIRASAVTIWPFIFIRTDVKDETRILQHEKIHIAQYQELWVLPFLFVYLWDFLVGLYKYKNARKAYQRIRFEQEAYGNDRNSVYLRARKPFRWRNYRV